MASEHAILRAFKLIQVERSAWKYTDDTVVLWAEELERIDDELLDEAVRYFLRSSQARPSLAGVLASVDAMREKRAQDPALEQDRLAEELRVQRFMRELPKQSWNGQEYDAPYNEGVRQRALSESSPRKLPPWYDPSASMSEVLERKRAYDAGQGISKPSPMRGPTTAAGAIGDLLDHMDEETPF